MATLTMQDGLRTCISVCAGVCECKKSYKKDSYEWLCRTNHKRIANPKKGGGKKLLWVENNLKYTWIVK